MGKQEHTCASCRSFYKPSGLVVASPANVGKCRRYPPQVQQVSIKQGGHVMAGIQSEFPSVRDNDCCGEYWWNGREKQKEPEAETVGQD